MGLKKSCLIARFALLPNALLVECFTKEKKRKKLGLLKSCLILRLTLLTDAFERGSSVQVVVYNGNNNYNNNNNNNINYNNNSKNNKRNKLSVAPITFKQLKIPIFVVFYKSVTIGWIGGWIDGPTEGQSYLEMRLPSWEDGSKNPNVCVTGVNDNQLFEPIER